MELPPKANKPYMRDPQEFLLACEKGDYEGVERMFKEFVITKTLMEGGGERALWNGDKKMALKIMDRYKGPQPVSWLGAAAKGGDISLYQIVAKRFPGVGDFGFAMLSGIQGGSLEMVKFIWNKAKKEELWPRCTSSMLKEALKFPDIFRYLKSEYHWWHMGNGDFTQEQEALVVLLVPGVREELRRQIKQFEVYGRCTRYVKYRRTKEDALKLWGDAEGLVIEAFKGCLEPDLVRNILTFFF